ncbi:MULTISPECIES: helix-turn-helix domain-containing protein [Streptomyces]|uniref:helix-turn-helix domain-containing protein n=1 Tax=Streptomyces TaxID=1883 RepID=UPI00211B2FE7|nr:MULTISPECIES: helix-turn-helix domain-containing protein [Streptomyces]MDX3611667.1 helix-turn-helix domain-containing protein [Streptomyces europaeiscabiei]MDX3630796.1 helix-turn-helix domain-containing protein [Streptomyces europaeiscabiei]MDX3649190.1 helix-turn-helix domain-containing protein [Streptomyces europaeiscabiei]WUD37287.1 helix-turn-helix domain-containing protein [Streptomyces europaeiscabiei]
MSAAGNALRAVQLLHERDELRVMDVAGELGVARSTAHRILAMLVFHFHGFAEQDRHKVYRPGPALQATRGSLCFRFGHEPADGGVHAVCTDDDIGDLP